MARRGPRQAGAQIKSVSGRLLQRATSGRLTAAIQFIYCVAAPLTPSASAHLSLTARDSRRNELRGGSMRMVKGAVDVAAPDEALAAAAGQVTPGEPYRYATKLRSILDNENNGYTV